MNNLIFLAPSFSGLLDYFSTEAAYLIIIGAIILLAVFLFKWSVKNTVIVIVVASLLYFFVKNPASTFDSFAELWKKVLG